MGDSEESTTKEMEAGLNDCQAETTAVPVSKTEEITQAICSPGLDKELSEIPTERKETEISKDKAQEDNGSSTIQAVSQSSEPEAETAKLSGDKAEEEHKIDFKENEIPLNDDEVAPESPSQSTESHEEILSSQSKVADVDGDEEKEEQSQPNAKAEVTDSDALVESVKDDATSSSSKEASREKKKHERSAELPRSRTMPKSYGRATRKEIAEKFGGVATPSSRVQRSTSCGASAVKNMLLEWCRSKTRGREGVDIQNFSSSWSNGLAFCALIVAFFPEAFDYNSLDPKNRRQNFQLAFSTAEELADCPPLLDVEDMVRMKVPDSKCVYTYVQELYRSLVAKGLVKTKKA